MAILGELPKISFLYFSSCLSNNSQQGKETTAALIPSAFNTSDASIAISTSEPVAIRVKSRFYEILFTR